MHTAPVGFASRWNAGGASGTVSIEAGPDADAHAHSSANRTPRPTARQTQGSVESGQGFGAAFPVACDRVWPSDAYGAPQRPGRHGDVVGKADYRNRIRDEIDGLEVVDQGNPQAPAHGPRQRSVAIEGSGETKRRRERPAEPRRPIPRRSEGEHEDAQRNPDHSQRDPDIDESRVDHANSYVVNGGMPLAIKSTPKTTNRTAITAALWTASQPFSSSSSVFAFAPPTR